MSMDMMEDENGCYPWDTMKQVHDDIRDKAQPDQSETTDKKLMRPQSGDEVDG